MRNFPLLVCLSIAALSSMISQAGAITVQSASDVFNSRSYLYLEAESASSIVDGGTTGDGWLEVSKEAPITSAGGLDILPPSSNVSGTALLDQIGGGINTHEDTAIYQIQFMTAGTYQFYSRHSMFDADGNNNYGNEDSIYVSPAFNLNSGSDWIGFEGLDFDESDFNVDIPNPGFALDPDGFKPSTGDSSSDGWYAIRDWGVKSAGSVSFPNNAAGPEWNGNFNWYNRAALVGATPANGFASDFGFKTEYTVTPEQVGQVLTFEISTREAYGAFDGFLFIQDDNVDLLDIYTQEELDALLPAPIVLDANFNDDSAVDGTDLGIWQAGYGSGSTHATGDADGDADVDGRDFLIWQRQFTGPPLLGAVPEPTSTVLLLGLSLSALLGNPRWRNSHR